MSKNKNLFTDNVEFDGRSIKLKIDNFEEFQNEMIKESEDIAKKLEMIFCKCKCCCKCKNKNFKK